MDVSGRAAHRWGMSDTTSETNAALIWSAYEAFSRGDLAGALAAFADDILWHVPGRGPLSGDYRGRDEVLAFFGQVNALSGGSFRVQIDDVLAKGDRVIVLCTESARRGDHSWSSPQIHVWTVKGRKATVFHQFQGDQQTEDEFWALPASDQPADDAFWASPA